MSGISYSNATVSKSDLYAIENYARALAAGGGGAVTTPEWISVSQQTSTSAFTNTGSILSLSGATVQSKSGGLFSVVSNQIRYTGTATSKTFRLRVLANVKLSNVSSATVYVYAWDPSVSQAYPQCTSAASISDFGNGVSPNPMNFPVAFQSIITLSNTKNIELRAFTSTGSAILEALSTPVVTSAFTILIEELL